MQVAGVDHGDNMEKYNPYLVTKEIWWDMMYVY